MWFWNELTVNASNEDRIKYEDAMFKNSRYEHRINFIIDAVKISIANPKLFLTSLKSYSRKEE